MRPCDDKFDVVMRCCGVWVLKGKS